MHDIPCLFPVLIRVARGKNPEARRRIEFLPECRRRTEEGSCPSLRPSVCGRRTNRSEVLETRYREAPPTPDVVRSATRDTLSEYFCRYRPAESQEDAWPHPTGYSRR